MPCWWQSSCYHQCFEVTLFILAARLRLWILFLLILRLLLWLKVDFRADYFLTGPALVLTTGRTCSRLGFLVGVGSVSDSSRLKEILRFRRISWRPSLNSSILSCCEPVCVGASGWISCKSWYQTRVSEEEQNTLSINSCPGLILDDSKSRICSLYLYQKV